MQLDKDYIDDFDTTRKLRPFSISNDGKVATCKVYWKSEKGNTWNYGGKVSLSARMFDKSSGFILETTQIAKEAAIRANIERINKMNDRDDNRSERKFTQR